MNTEPEIDRHEALALPGDFADRVLREVARRRNHTQRLRTLGAGVAVAALLFAGGLPLRLARVLTRRHPAPTVMVTGIADDGLTADETELDPGSYFGTEVMVASAADEDGEGDW